MVKRCPICNIQLDALIPYNCKRCGLLYCNKHRLPENHSCSGLKHKDNITDWMNEEEKFKEHPEVKQPTDEIKITTPDDSSDEKPRKEKKQRRHKEPRKKKHRRSKQRRNYTIWETIRYRFRRLRIPEWFVLTFIAMIIVAILHQYYELPLGIISFPTIYYILELIVVAYFMFRLIKVLDNISVHSDLRMFGLRLLSGLITMIGLFLLYLLYFGLFFSVFDEGWAEIYYFGKDFGLPLTGYFIFLGISIGLMVIGAYLYFKFKRGVGTFHWIGRA